MGTWMARLDGDTFDLEALSDLFQSPDCLIRKMDDGTYCLGARAFDALADASAVRDAVIALIPKIIGSARLQIPILKQIESAGGLIHLHESGAQSVTVFAPPISFRARTSVSVSAVENEPRPASDAEMALRRVEGKPDLKEVLHLFGLEQNWSNLYKTVEAVERVVGGERHLIARNWVPEGDLKAFKRTANSREALGDDARHGPSRHLPPSAIMSIDMAKQMVRTLVTNVLADQPKT